MMKRLEMQPGFIKKAILDPAPTNHFFSLSNFQTKLIMQHMMSFFQAFLKKKDTTFIKIQAESNMV